METYKAQLGQVYVVDDDEHVCQFIEKSLKSSDYAVTSCFSAEEFLRQELIVAPCCLLLDLVLPGDSGISLCREVVNRKLACSIVFISGNADVASSVEAMKLGAIDFLQKPCTAQLLVETVALALREANLMNQLRQQETGVADSLESLTSRERDILSDVAQGLLTKEIAKKRGISHRTVEVHRSHIMQKLKLESPLQLAHIISVMERCQFRVDQNHQLLRKNYFPANGLGTYPRDEMVAVQ